MLVIHNCCFMFYFSLYLFNSAPCDCVKTDYYCDMNSNCFLFTTLDIKHKLYFCRRTFNNKNNLLKRTLLTVRVELKDEFNGYKLLQATATSIVQKMYSLTVEYVLTHICNMQFMCILTARSLLVLGKKSRHIRKTMCQLERSQLSMENKWAP